MSFFFENDAGREEAESGRHLAPEGDRHRHHLVEKNAPKEEENHNEY